MCNMGQVQLQQNGQYGAGPTTVIQIGLDVRVYSLTEIDVISGQFPLSWLAESSESRGVLDVLLALRVSSETRLLDNGGKQDHGYHDNNTRTSINPFVYVHLYSGFQLYAPLTVVFSTCLSLL